ncbi:MAG: hypothetical protein KVP17_004437 [Porospora cf. gigantea B]|uniref:uncharacterized protein n=1 Tax=Porospora cf. gigantea B TaxID=2853592 RepID=UPI003571B89E|nr:MAG: hypothetical protein KVP17_004437 [Porospora cf. gigantea B]
MPDIKDKGLNPMLTVNPSSLLTLLPAQWSVSSQPSTSLPADEVVKPELKAARFKVDIEPSEAPPTEDQNEFPFNAFPEARGHSAVSDPFRVLINVQHPNPSRPVLTADLMEYLYFPCTTLPAYLAKTAQNLLHEARSTPDLSLASQQRSAERQSIPITWATAAALTDITAMGHSQLPSPVPYFLVLSGGEWFFITFQNGTKNRDRSEHFFAVACEICHCPSNPNLVPIVQLNFSQADVAAVIAPAVTPLLLVYFKHQPPLLIHLSPHSSSWLGRDSFLRSLMNSVPSDASGGFALHPVLRTSTSRFCLGPGLHAFATWNDSFILVNGDVPLMLQPSPAFLVPCLVALGPSDWVDDRTVYRKQLASKSRPVDPKRVCVWERGMVGFQGRHLIFGRDVDSVVRLSLDALQLLQNFSLNLGTAVGSHRRHLHCIAAEFNTKIVFGWESQSVQQAMSSLLSSHKMAITTFEDAETRFRDSLLRKLHSQLLS